MHIFFSCLMTAGSSFIWLQLIWIIKQIVQQWLQFYFFCFLCSLIWQALLILSSIWWHHKVSAHLYQNKKGKKKKICFSFFIKTSLVNWSSKIIWGKSCQKLPLPCPFSKDRVILTLRVLTHIRLWQLQSFTF